ncbi:hypothetical protein AX16_004164 [Volvariella volvacea WC 439]|nr:hypothetical protein AX16_004164 [Volvariella volvacea WC 439]
MAEPLTARSAAIVAQRAALLKKEAEIAVMLSEVRTGLNNLLPISQLPTDILEDIFAICVSWLYGNQKPKNRLAWTQVCRVWRQVSLDSARLWRCIDLSDSRLAREFLKRSKTSPISMISASPLKLYTDDLHPHAERLQSIDVFLFPDDMNDLFDSIGPNLSNLTDLSLRIPPVSASIRLDIPLPRVRRLNLEAVSLGWSACTSLTHLSLRGMISSFAPSISELQTIFSKSPHLEYIRLENIDSLSTETEEGQHHHPPAEAIPLNNLQELIVFAKDRVVTSILSSISFPPTTRLRLRFQDLHSFFSLRVPYDHHHHHHVPDSEAYYNNYSNTYDHQKTTPCTLRLTRAGFHLLPHPHPNTPKPWSEDPHDILVSVFSSPSPPTASSSSSSSSPSLSHLSLRQSLSSILASLSITLNALWSTIHITALELGADVLTPDMPKQDLESFLDSLPHLTTIRVCKNPIEGLISLLSAPDNEHDASAEAKISSLPHSTLTSMVDKTSLQCASTQTALSHLALVGSVSVEKGPDGVWRRVHVRMDECPAGHGCGGLGVLVPKLSRTSSGIF